MTRPLSFTEASVRRAVRAARKVGLRVTGIRPDGTIAVEDVDNSEQANQIARPPPRSKWEDRRA